jgi:hypothetical protein
MVRWTALTSALLFIICNVLNSLHSFRLQAYRHTHLSILRASPFDAENLMRFKYPSAPKAKLSRLLFNLTGSAVNNPVFIHELRKELTFYRGCNASMVSEIEPSTATVLAEGRTRQLAHFLNWLNVLSVDVRRRRLPQVITDGSAQLESAQWLSASIVPLQKGFNIVPSLPSASSSAVDTPANLSGVMSSAVRAAPAGTPDPRV